MSEPNKHASHPSIANRLKRAEGHLRSIIAMIEEGRPCLDIAQQLQAVEKAITQAKRTLIHDHLDHCLDDAENGGGATHGHTLSEFRQIAKYL
ncbi:MAG: metal-sensing transcriptional repressor [Afipia sp.]|nr:metal-sensing transcriptional repressor [Afipia sp.]